MSRKEMMKKLEKIGFKLERTTNHMIYKKDGLMVSLPDHNKINKRTCQTILKKAQGCNV